MTIKITENLFETRYRDDYSDSDGYARILFNNGRHLQARELTQSQTIIQKQIERLGRNIFKEGANVIPGSVTLNDKYEFIKLNTNVYTMPTDGSIIGETFLGQNSNVRVKVLEAVAATSSDPATLYVEYTNTISGTTGATAIRIDPNEDLVGISTGTILRVQTTNTISNPVAGRGVRFSVGSGSFFINGFFAHSNAQNIMLQKYATDYTGVVGFKVSQDVVTSDDNAALFDNSQKLPNTTAPGADRYRIALTLIDEADIESTDTFVYLAKIVNSEVVDAVSGFDQYNKINELMALRTKEESGNYLVKPFTILFDSADASNLNLIVSDGTAYVNGYRVYKNYPTEISVPRAQATEELENEVVASNYGNYIIVENMLGLSDITSFAEVNLYGVSTFTGAAPIGTCRVRSVDAVGDGTYRIYIFNISMNVSRSFREVKGVGSGTTNFATFILENGNAVLKDANNLDLLFDLPNDRPSNIDDISYQVQRKFTGTTDVSGNLTLALSATGETFANTNNWITSLDSSGSIVTPTISGSGTTSADLSALPNFSVVEVLGYVNKGAATIKNKLKTTVTGQTSTLSTGPGGERYVDTAIADAFKINYMRQDSANGEDITDQFILDTGQRDAYYDISSLILKGGLDVPTNVYWSVDHFQHTVGGDFFAVNSYSGIPYADIPTYTKKDGAPVDLRDVLDFRPVKNISGTFNGGSARVIELPRNTDVITSDITYYLPRHDKVVVDELGNLNVLQGVSDLSPKFSAVPSNSLELYRVKLNAFTLDNTDMQTQFIETKGYTMKDINFIEKRVDRLEETVGLDKLEIDTSTFEVIDSNGSNRTKSGFAVDNFADHFFSDTKNLEYRAAINPSERTLNPAYSEKNVGLVYDSDNSTNTQIKGDNVYIKHTDVDYLVQSQVSNAENVNPSAAYLFNGTLNLSPSSDEWRDVNTKASVVIQGGTLLDTNQELLSGINEWGWNGVDRNSVAITRVVTSQTIRNIVDDRIIDLTIVPFIRSRKVFFKAVGLRPNTQIIPYFDRKDVAVWCKSEAFQNINSNKASVGNTQRNATTHPDGSSTLYTNSKGEVSGSFFIPNTDAIRFRAGVREFTLLDITSYDLEAASSIAAANYTAEGAIETKLQTIVSTRKPQSPNRSGDTKPRRTDPLAQSFYVSEKTGVFITKARLFFKTKSADMPVWIQMRPMVNGHPSSSIVVPGSNKILSPTEVSTSADATIGTDFVFDEPLYLKPETEYAIVLLADTNDYQVYISKMGEFILNSTEKRITKQPTLGSLFKSQNASTWTPSQIEDLMFTLYRASFEVGTSTAYLENESITNNLLVNDAIKTNNASTKVEVLHKSNDLLVGDTVTLSGITESIGGISADSINGNHIVTEADGFGYAFDLDSNATKTELGGGVTITSNENTLMDKIYPYIETINPENTTLQFKGKFHNGKSYAGSEAAYGEDTVYSPINNKENNYFASPKIIAHSTKEAALGSKTLKINVDMGTTSEWVSPVLDLQRASVIALSNRIDDQASSPTANKNVPLTYVAETDPVAGSHLSKHIIKPVTLVNDAVGLKILISANRPSVSNIDVYYKVITENERLDETDWSLITPEEEVPSDENRSVFRDYRYLVGGVGGTLDAFTVFQIKIVMRSSNSSKVPTIKDLRAIALGI